MSQKKWIIVAAFALVDVIVLGIVVVTVIESLTRTPSQSTPIPVVVASLTSAATPPPTWTPVSTSTPRPTPTTRPSRTPVGTATPWPTPTSTALPTPAPVPLENPTFEGVQENLIPGWQTGAFVNWAPGDEFDPAASYAAPRFHQADDSRQWISGPTLQIDTAPWIKLRAWVFQTVELAPGSRVQFLVSAMGFVKDEAGGYILKVGVDPDGGDGCDAAQWGLEQIVSQDDGVVEVSSPRVVVGQAGRATVCIFAETQFAQAYHAAFFDDAVLTTLPSTP